MSCDSNSKLGIISGNDPGKIKTIDKQDEHYYQLPVEKTHSPDELAALHRAIRYTQLFKQDEAEVRHSEVELIERVLPSI